MDVRRLRVLRELADRGSVAAVADALSFTPSAISQQLRALQREVGVVLTEPAGRGLRLTEAGLALAGHADSVLAALAEAEAAVERYRSEPTGVVRVAMFQSAARLLLAPVLHRLGGLAGIEARFSDVDMTPAEVPGLAAGFDLVVAHRDEHAPPFATDRWEVTHLLREPLDVALPPGHRLARHPRLRLVDLTDEPWISVQEGFPVDDVLRSIALRTGTQPGSCSGSTTSGSPRSWWPRGSASRCCRATPPTTGVAGGWSGGRWPRCARPGWSRRWPGAAPWSGRRCARCSMRCAPRPTRWRSPPG